jgi:Family of unknown function (DUF6134)
MAPGVRMLTRRRCLLTAAASCIAASPEVAGVPPGGRLNFRIIRKGEDIGSHRLTFTSVPNGLDINIAVRIAVSVGPITLFHYQLDGVEQWREGQVMLLATQTNDDGTKESVRAVRDRQGLWVSGTNAQRYLAPFDALPATHWNEAELRGPWINPQDGRLLQPTVMRPVSAQAGVDDDSTGQHYAISGDLQMQLWYTPAHRWAGLTFKAHDGSLVSYEPA